jgi:hypothetical protein
MAANELVILSSGCFIALVGYYRWVAFCTPFLMAESGEWILVRILSYPH